MRFLADENIPRPSVARIRDAGHDVLSMSEERPEAADRDVLALATETGRILITFDRDYGDLIFHRGLPGTAGVVYLRFIAASPLDAAARLLALVARPGTSLEGVYTTLRGDDPEPRQRPIPPAD